MPKLTKTDKKPSEFDGMEPDYEKRLEVFDRKTNTNKFWRVWVYGEFVVRHWGRHGTKGQKAVHSAWNEWGAKTAALFLVDQRIWNKNYKDEAGILDRFAREVS